MFVEIAALSLELGCSCPPHCDFIIASISILPNLIELQLFLSA